MEETWRRDRVLLDQLLRRHPELGTGALAREVGRSVGWVKKWRPRLLAANPEDLNRFSSQSRAHHAPYYRWDSRVEDRIVEMREEPPGNLQRIPGPKALLYYLPRDPELQELGLPLPRSTRTIWKILCKNGMIAEEPKGKKRPLEAREPLEEVQMDGHRISLQFQGARVHKASSNILSRSVTLWMQVPLYCSRLRRVRIFTPRRPCKPSSPFSKNMVVLPS